MGEPLLHPNLAEFLKIAGDFGFKVSEHCTEEHLLTDAFEDARLFWASNAQDAEHQALTERLNELSEKIVTE
jgi:hypothetical protein